MATTFRHLRQRQRVVRATQQATAKDLLGACPFPAWTWIHRDRCWWLKGADFSVGMFEDHNPSTFEVFSCFGVFWLPALKTCVSKLP